MELVNLAESLEPQELRKIAELCLEEFQEDVDSRQGWEEIHATYKEIYYQQSFPDTPPWSGASKESIPILTESCNIFQARAYKAFFPNREFISAVALDQAASENLKAAEKVSKYLSYQLGFKMRNYKADKKQMFLAVAIDGSDFSKVYYDVLKKQVCVERVRASDLVIPYTVGNCHIDDLERKTHIIHMSINKSRMLAKKGFFVKEARPFQSFNDSDIRAQVEDSAHGLTESSMKIREGGSACVLEQHRLLDLDEDGIAEPYIVWIDRESRDILRIQVRYEVGEDGEATENKEPIEYFTHYGFLPNPDGFYNIGLGMLLAQLNTGINKITRQIIDAGTLANVGNMSGFMSEALGVKGDGVELVLGQFTKIPKTVDDIRKAVFQFQFPGPNPAYMQTLEMLQDIASRISSTTDAVTGDVGKVIQPLSLQTMLESSLQMPTSVMEQLAHSMEDELNKIYRIYQKHGPIEDSYEDDGEHKTIGLLDFEHKFMIRPIFDPKQVTQQQRIAKSQQLFSFAEKNPVIMNNPSAMTEVTRRVLKSLDTENIDEILPPPPEMQNFGDQDIENLYYILPPEDRPQFDVSPEDDHITHIDKIDAVLATITRELSPEDVSGASPMVLQLIQAVGNEMLTQIVPDLMNHRRKHVAYLMTQAAMGSNGQGFGGRMAQRPSDALDVSAIGGEFQPPAIGNDMPAGGLEAFPGSMGSAELPAEPAGTEEPMM